MRKEVKIGIFAFSMLILLFWGINFLKGKNLFTSSNTFYTAFDNVSGLNVSADVMYRGIKVGTVTDIEFNPQTPDKITVEFTVNKKFPLPNDSRVVSSSPIIGSRVLVIEYGRSPEMYRNGDNVPSVNKPELIGQLTDGIEPVKEQLAEITASLALTLDKMNRLFSEENLENFSSTISGISQIVNNDVRQTFRNLNLLGQKLNASTVEVDRILSNVGDITDSLSSANVPQLVDNINETVIELNKIIALANEGDGNLAMLLHDPGLYEGLKSSSENLSALLEDMKAHPKRYVHFSLFGKKDK